MPRQQTERRDTTVISALKDINDKLAITNQNLAVNTNETRNIRDRLDKLNGSISNHESRLNALDRNHELLTQIVANQTKKEDSHSDIMRRWTDRAMVFAVMLLGYLLYYLLTHAGFPHFLAK